MNTRYQILFHGINYKSNPNKIAKVVMDRIVHTRTVHDRNVALGYSILTFIIVVACVPVIQSFIREMTQSGVLDYISLLLSDSSYVASNWREFTLSLLESVPLFTSMLMLSLVLVFIVSIRKGVTNILSFRNRKYHVMNA